MSNINMKDKRISELLVRFFIPFFSRIIFPAHRFSAHRYIICLYEKGNAINTRVV
jgi:hypothetical protein